MTSHDFSKLRYADEHPLRDTEIVLDDHTHQSFIYMFDAKSLRLQDFSVLGDSGTVPLITIKSILANTAESFMGSFAKNTHELLILSEPRIQKKVAGRVLVTPQQAAQHVQYARSRLEDFIYRLTSWNGDSTISVLLPYAHVPTKPNVIIGQPPVIDEESCIPYVDGVWITGAY